MERLMEMLRRLEEVGDVEVYETDSYLGITLQDFEGFTDSWEEEYRDYTDASLVEELEDYLDTFETTTDGLLDFYLVDGQRVFLTTSSMDI